MRIGQSTKEMILFSLAGQSGQEAKRIMQDLHEQTGLSVSHLYRISASVRGSTRATRKDSGVRRMPVSDEQLEQVKELTVKYDLAAGHAIRLAELNQWLREGELSEGTYNAWLRRQGASRKRFKTDVAPTRRFEAPGPNVLHHFDTTKLEQLHFSPDRVLSWDPRANRKNSRGEKPPAIWLYSLVDDYSRCKYAYLYPSLNQYNHLDFLYRAWAQKERPSEFPFYGIPGHLYMDKGGGNYSLKVIGALKKLGVHVVPTTPSTWEPFGSRKHGKVENVFKSYGEWLKEFQIRDLTWEEAQESLYQYLLLLNRRPHSTTGTAPYSRWLEVSSPRHMPDRELYQLLKYDHDYRVVTRELAITIDRHLYVLPEKRPYVDWINQKIEVYWQPGEYETVYAVKDSVEIELKERKDNVVRPAFSYPREQRDETAVELARKQAADTDHQEMKLYATDSAHPAYLPRKGEEFDETAIAEKKVETTEGTWRPSFAPMRWLNKVDVRREAAAAGLLGEDKLSDAEVDWLSKIMNGRRLISEDEFEQTVRQTKAKKAEDCDSD